MLENYQNAIQSQKVKMSQFESKIKNITFSKELLEKEIEKKEVQR